MTNLAHNKRYQYFFFRKKMMSPKIFCYDIPLKNWIIANYFFCLIKKKLIFPPTTVYEFFNCKFWDWWMKTKIFIIHIWFTHRIYIRTEINCFIDEKSLNVRSPITIQTHIAKRNMFENSKVEGNFFFLFSTLFRSNTRKIWYKAGKRMLEELWQYT